MRKVNMSFVLSGLLSLILTGCISTKSYVDPNYGKVKYEDIARRTEPYRWRLLAEFQRNGSRLPAVDAELMGHVERVIRASGIVEPTTEVSAPVIKVIVNNIADFGSAIGKGLGTGFSFGHAGNTVSDYYEMEVVLTDGMSVTKKTGYKHAIHTTIGNINGPEGLEPMSINAAFGKVIEQLILNVLKDIERDKLTLVESVLGRGLI
jgi:hypothetical protein